MKIHSIVTFFFVAMAIGVGVNSQTVHELKECLVDILEKALQPEYQNNTCLLGEDALTCVLTLVVADFDLSELSIQIMQNEFDASPRYGDCNVNVRQIVQEAKNTSRNATDDDVRSPESVARRKAMVVCMDEMIAKAQIAEYQEDPCRMTEEAIPCLVKAMSLNQEPTGEAIKGLQIGLDALDSSNCSIDVRKVLAGNAAPASISESFLTILVMFSLSVFLLARE